MSDLTQLRTPPHSDEAESALLAAMIDNNRLITEFERLTPEDFYRREHQVIYRHLLALSMTNRPADAVTLAAAMKAAGEFEEAGGTDFLVDLISGGRGSHNAKAYAEIILNKSLSRQMIRVGHEIAEMGFSSEGEPPIDDAQSLALALTPEKDSAPEIIRSVLQQTIADITRRHDANGEIIGQPTGFTDIDNMTSGLQPGQMVVLAGRPGSGKTTFAMNVMEHLALQGKFCMVFNLEMTKVNLAMKSLSSLGRIPYKLVRAGKINDHTQNLTAAAAKLMDGQVYIDDSASLTSGQILSRCRKVSQRAGRKLDLLVVDYLQLLNDKGEGHERITRISRALKIAAKELGCPVLALSQLNRSLENRADKRPIMSDLRECLPTDEWVDTPAGPVQLRTKPGKIITASEQGIRPAPCEYIYKKQNKVFRVATPFGSFSATAKHLVLTGTGWKRVRDLQPGRDVVACPKKIPHASHPSILA